jgi:phosphoglycolate phosphatase
LIYDIACFSGGAGEWNKHKQENSMKLIIFDLDQTLVDFIDVHDKATQRLFRDFWGVDVRLTEINFAGKSLTVSFFELARFKNIPEAVFKMKSQQLLKTYETTFDKSLPEDAEKHILPGARELLNELSRRDHIKVLYTGDSPAIVASVFRVTGLGKYFMFCVYGTEAETRADMVRLAVSRAKKMTGRDLKNKEIVIIGDSTWGIKCGRLFDATTIAIATGFHSRAELSAVGPDYLFDNLKGYEKILKVIG